MSGMTRPILKLLSSIAVIVVLWGFVLPRLSSTQAVKERERWLEQHGIDPAAMFYTELPLLDEIVD